jgi:hypothetical protein
MTDGPGGEPREDDDILDLGGSHARWFETRWSAPRWASSRRAQAFALTVALAAGLTIGLMMNRAAKPPAVRALQHDVSRISTTAVRALANQHELTNYVRQDSPAGACALVAVGHSPARAISRAIRAALPGYVLLDAGGTLDEYTGLCSTEVRATCRTSTLVVRVTSPAAHATRSAYTRVETGIETNDGATTKYALAINETGWTVLVGATGRSADLPRAQDLVRLAGDPVLIW